VAFPWRLWPRRGKVESAPAPPPRIANFDAILLEPEHYEIVAAVGESHHQPELRDICGSARWEEVRYRTTAVLVPEPENPHDPMAVAVVAGAEDRGRPVGHLSRGDAADYYPAVVAAARADRLIACHALICGRGPGSETMNVGIFLHLPEAEDALREVEEHVRE